MQFCICINANSIKIELSHLADETWCQPLHFCCLPTHHFSASSLQYISPGGWTLQPLGGGVQIISWLRWIVPFNCQGQLSYWPATRKLEAMFNSCFGAELLTFSDCSVGTDCRLYCATKNLRVNGLVLLRMCTRCVSLKCDRSLAGNGEQSGI